MQRGNRTRRAFLKLSSMAALGLVSGWPRAKGSVAAPRQAGGRPAAGAGLVTLFLCGDVMLGRGVDQVLPHPGDPRIHDRRTHSALTFVELAERAHGPIPRPVEPSYVWGDALEELARVRPDVRIVNLETAVTRSDDRAPKEIHYRMHPENIACLTAAGIDCCALANNHVLDYGPAGLAETLETLQKANVRSAGAGRNRAHAEAPAILALPGGRRVIVLAFGSVTAGIPRDWAASEDGPGVNLLEEKEVSEIAASVRRVKQPGDVVVASLHWGGNWGYEIPSAQRALARVLLDGAGVDVIHGHSSHHPKGIEVHGGKPILYGCGDFLNDYEGIEGHEEFRKGLVLMYFVTLDPASRKLVRLEMTPLRIERFRLERASAADARWLRDTLDRAGAELGTRVQLDADDRLTLGWGSLDTAG